MSGEITSAMVAQELGRIFGQSCPVEWHYSIAEDAMIAHAMVLGKVVQLAPIDTSDLTLSMSEFAAKHLRGLALKAALTASVKVEQDRLPGPRLGDYYTHDGSGVRFVCAAITNRDRGDGTPVVTIELQLPPTR